MQTDCGSDTYGYRCGETCGQCRGDECDPSDGTCPDGCHDWYLGSRCRALIGIEHCEKLLLFIQHINKPHLAYV